MKPGNPIYLPSLAPLFFPIWLCDSRVAKDGHGLVRLFEMFDLFF